jgi:hypothetical protein
MSVRFKLPAIMATDTAPRTTGSSYAMICPTARMPPTRVNLLCDPYAAITIAIVESAEIART